MSRRILLAAIALLAGFGPAGAAPPIEGAPLASALGDESEPAISPDGKWLAYTLREDGRRSLYARRIDWPANRQSIAIAAHPSDTWSPTFSPDGKWLAFLTTRRDALGDAAIVEFPSGQTRVLSVRGYADSEPVWDDSRILSWRTEDYLGIHRSRANRSGSAAGAGRTQPHPAPPFPGAAQTFRDALALPMSDTNGDGVLGRDDDSAVWLFDAKSNTWHPATRAHPGITDAAITPDGKLVVSVTRGGGLDLILTERDVAFDGTPAELLSRAVDAELAGDMELSRDLALAAALAPGAPESVRGPAAARFGSIEISNARAAAIADVLRAFESSDGDVRALRIRADLERVRRSSEIGETRAATLAELQREIDASSSTRPSRGDEPYELQLAAMERAFLAGDFLAALGTASEGQRDTPERFLSQRLLLHSQIAAASGDPVRESALLEELLRDFDDLRKRTDSTGAVGERDLAITRLVAIAKSGLARDEAAASLRTLASTTSSVHLRAAARLEAARMSRLAGRTDEAISDLELVTKDTAAPADSRVVAATMLAEALADLGRFEDAVAVWSSVGGESPEIERRVRAGLATQLESKGREELRLGDPALALGTFNRILESYPESVTAWRGRIGAEALLGVPLAESLPKYKALARAKDAGALAWYRHGLALSYVPGKEKESTSALERAVALDGSVGWYRQTLGYVLEQRWRVGGKRDLAIRAFDEYEAALAFLPPESGPEALAALLQNAGNMALALDRDEEADRLFTRREGLAAPFANVANEFLFRYFHGIAAFRSESPEVAARQLSRALTLLPEVEKQFAKDLPADEAASLSREIRDRLALALDESGQHIAAADTWSALAQDSAPRSMDGVRAHRNAGLALLRAREFLSADDALAAALRARTEFEVALTSLDRARAAGSDAPSQRGALGISVVLAQKKEVGGALLNLSATDEERLVRGGLVQALEALGDQSGATKAAANAVLLAPKSGGDRRPYDIAQRGEVLLRAAEEFRHGGKLAEASAALTEAIESARFRLAKDELTNADLATNALLRLAEIAMRDRAAIDATRLGKSWLFEKKRKGAVAPTDALATLDEAARRLLDPAVSGVELDASLAMRMHMVRALASESRGVAALEQPSANPLDELRAASMSAVGLAEAERAAETILEQRMLSRGDAEGARLALLAKGMLVRIAARRGDDPALENLLDASRGELPARGQAAWLWWIEAQVALAHPDADVRARAIVASRDALMATLPGDVLPEDESSAELVRLLADRDTTASGPNDVEPAWDAAEAWNVASRRLAFSDATPPGRGESDAEWLREAIARRAENARLTQRLRESSPIASPALDRASAQLAAARIALRSHLDHGVEADFPSARLLRPLPTSLADASILGEDAELLPKPAAVILPPRGSASAVAVAPEPMRKLPADSASLAHDRPIWLSLAAPLLAVPPGVTAISMTSTADFLRGLESLPLKSRAESVHLDAATLADAARLKTAGMLVLDVPLGTRGDDPFAWTIGDTGVTLARALRGAPSAREFVATVHPISGSGPRRAAQEAALASMLESCGIVEATWPAPNGSPTRWIGAAFDPKEAPALVANALDGARGEALESLQQGDASRALPPLEVVVSLKEATGDADGLTLFRQLLAQAYSDLRRYPEAVAPASAAVADLRAAGEAPALADGLMRLGSAAARARQWQLALDSYREAADLRTASDDARGALEALVQLGVTLENSGESASALDAFARARDLAASTGDVVLVAEQNRRRARVLSLRLNDYHASEEITRSILDEITQWIARAQPLPEGATALEVATRLDLGRVLERRGLYDDSLAEVARALELARTNGLEREEGEALRDAANVEWLRSNYLASFQRQRESLAIAQRIGDAPLLISLHNVAGLTKWSVNDLQAALAEFDEALGLARRESLDTEAATSLNNRAIALRAMRDYDGALRGFDAAYEADRSMNSRWGMAYSRRNYGVTLIDMGRAAEAVEPIREGIALAEEIGDRTSGTKGHLFLGDAYRRSARPDEARAEYESALAAAVQIPLPEVAWRAHHGLGLLARASGDMPEAILQFDAAIARIETLRAAIRIEEFQDGFLADKQEPYDELVTALMDRGDLRGAFEVSERARGRNFIDLLGNRQLALPNPADEQLLARERALRVALEEAEKRAGSAPNELVLNRMAELEAAKRAHADFLIELRAANPELGAFVRVEPVSLTEIQALLESDTRILVYHVTSREVLSWLIGPDSIESARVAVRREELATRIETLRMRIQAVDDVAPELRLLAQTLTEPLAGKLAGVKHLGIVPHRELHALPFAAIPEGVSGEPLIVGRALFSAPSTSVLRYTFARRRPEGTPLGRVLALGNPAGVGVPDLPFAQKEAERLADQFPTATLVTGVEATESWLEANVSGYSIVHIASHGEFDPSSPLNSALKLTPDSANDGSLTSAEVFSLPLEADMVTLSACQTGLGRLSNGDDIVGLNRAFVFAGTRQIVSTLWRVDDVSTAVLMKHFYRNMGDMDRSEALRQAQLSVRSRNPHPAFWASVVLAGDWK